MTEKMPSFRIDIRPAQDQNIQEYVGRAEHLSPRGCAIRSSYRPDPGAVLELRLYLPGTSWPVAVDRAQVTWGHWDSFTVEFHDPQACRMVAAYLA
jgi:hypothetical protein